MLIDWFTVAAQIINFLLLVWLLKRFLFGRILRAIETRERGIAQRLAEADAKDTAAAEQLALYQAKLHEFEQQRQELLAQAKLEAGKQQAALLAEAREQVRALGANWETDLDRERNSFLTDLRRRAATEILALARQTVADLACVDIQRCAVQVFLEKIRALDQDACLALSKGELEIRTAFDMPEAMRAEVQQALRERLDAPVTVRFERAPGVGLGIELRGNGWRIGWNSESYLERLEEDLREALEQRGARAAGAHAGAL
jgi:F-type H+-transporting ATPase subunit b